MHGLVLLPEQARESTESGTEYTQKKKKETLENAS